MSDLAPCAQHADVPAGWRCDGCQKLLCGACTAAGVSNQFYCGVCGSLAKRLMIARTARPRSFWIVETLAYPFKQGLPFVALMGLFLAIVGFGAKLIAPDSHDLDTPVLVVRVLAMVIYTLLVVDSTARGGQRESGAGMRLLRGLAATAVVWLPGLAYVYFVGVPRLGGDGILWLFLALATIYLPIALVASVNDVTLGDVTSPWKVFAMLGPLGVRGVRLVATVAVLGAATIQIAKATGGHVQIATPLVGDLVAVLPALIVFTILAHAIGLYPHIHGERLHWGAAETFSDPLLPRAQATGQRKLSEVLTTEKLTQGSGGGSSASTSVPIEERNDARRIAELIKGENLPRALRLYEARPTWNPATFDDRQLLALGKAAARSKKPELALALYAEGISREGRGVAQLLIAQGQLFGELGRAAESRAAYHKVIELFPNSDPAKIAQRALE